MNKKGLQITNALFAVVVVSMAVISIGVVGQGWSDKYNSGLTYDLDEYENLDDLSDQATGQKNKVTPTDPDPSSGDFEGKIFRGGYGIIGSIFTPFTATFNMLKSLENRFGLPSYTTQGILTIMVFALIGSIIAVVFRLGRAP